MNLADETPGIVRAALSYGIDPLLPRAIRQQEGDPPDSSLFGEFGVLKSQYPTYTDRLHGCCATLRGLIQSYLGNPYEIIETNAGHRRLRYMQVVIEHIGHTYCPVGPGMPDKNSTWIPGVWQIYSQATVANAPLV